MTQIVVENGTDNKSVDQDLKIPAWIDDAYFEDILKRDGKSEWRLQSWNVKMANKKGENYASIMYRAAVTAITVDGSIEKISYVLKVGPESGELIKQFNVFEKEIEMYSNVVPALEKCIAHSGKNIQFGPKCFKSSIEPTEQMVMEDLAQYGFKMANRLNGLDMDHTKLLLSKLAVFHASSACVVEKNGPFSKCLLESMWNDSLESVFGHMFDTSFSLLFDVIKTQWPHGGDFAEKMRNFKDEYFPTCRRLFSANKDGFNVLNHGDIWTNNAMFKYEDGRPIDMLFLDFQMSVWASPAVDLCYFIISSVNIDLKVAEFDTIIQYYHSKLAESLSAFGYKKKIPTLHELQRDILEHGFLLVNTALGVYPITLLENCENAEMENFMKNDENAIKFKTEMYSNPRYIKGMEVLIPFFDKKGLLDRQT